MFNRVRAGGVVALLVVASLLSVPVPAVAVELEWLGGSTVAQTTVEVSRHRFDGGRTAPYAVLVRDDVYADALAGSVLTGPAPLLATTSTGLDALVRAELRRVLSPGSPVVLLGGAAALSRQVEAQVSRAGLVPVRLQGTSRLDTARRIVEVARGEAVPGPLRGLLPKVDRHRVLVARAHPAAGDTSQVTGWVDAVAGGAWAAQAGVPVMLTDSHRLDATTASVVRNVRRVIVLGGTAAVSAQVEGHLKRSGPAVQRLAGADRTATADLVASRLWRRSGGPSVLVPGWSPSGWAAGLAAAGLAADTDRPLRLVDPRGARSDCRGAATVVAVDGTLPRAGVRLCGRDAPASGPHTFLGQYEGLPVRWCAPMELEVNWTGAPTGARQALQAAVAELNRHSYVPVRVVGESTDRSPSATVWPANRLVGDPSAAPAPVLVSWPPIWDSGAIGYGASRWGLSHGMDRPVFFAGNVTLKMGFGEGNVAAQTELMIHEIGHVLGLGHVDDPNQIMYPLVEFGRLQTTLQGGDIEGLRTMGTVAC